MATSRARISIASALLAIALSGCSEASRPDLVVYEDGSGVLFSGDRIIHQYPAETFEWDCHTMGNGRCGDVDDGHLAR